MRHRLSAGTGRFTVSVLITIALFVSTGPQAIAQNHAPRVVAISNPNYAYDYRDDRILVGVSEHVFLGEVLEQVGDEGVPTSDPETEIPQTQFRVRVLHVIKGELPDEVIVSQGSGVEKGTNTLTLIGGDPLLKPMELVLFAVNPEPDFNCYTIVAGPFGTTRAKDLAEADALIARFTEAERSQFVPARASEVVAEEDAGREDSKRPKRRNKRHKRENGRIVPQIRGPDSVIDE